MEGRKKNQIRYVCTRILETSEQGLIACTLKTILKKFSAARATAYAYRANEYTLEKKMRYLPAWGFPEGVEQ